MNDTTVSHTLIAPWLLLIHSLPPKPDYLRVKVRRRLQRLGAAPLKNSVYVLPNEDESREDFVWLARAIVEDGGEATICEATFLEGMTNEEMEAMIREQMRRDEPEAGAMLRVAVAPRGATWVTRQGPKVDRMASAWLIRRFIDPAASFKFVPPTGYQPRPGELRFDMYQGEYGHEGDRCTFETLLARFGLRDPALAAIGEIVHDVDCKDDKFQRPEASGIALQVQDIVSSQADDLARLARGAAMMDEVYTTLGGGTAAGG